MAADYLFVGEPDVDRSILLNVDRKELKDLCMFNSYAVSICDQTFWRNKFEKDYGALGVSQGLFDYKRAYFMVDPSNIHSTWVRAVENDMSELKRWAERRGAPELHLTGVSDVDRAILLNLDNRLLFAVCSFDDYTKSVCDPYFWKAKFTKHYGALVGVSRMFNYQEAYRILNQSSSIEVLRIASEWGELPFVAWVWNRHPEKYSISPHLLRVIDTAVANNHLPVVRFIVERAQTLSDDDITLLIEQAALKYDNLPVVQYLVEEVATDFTPDELLLSEIVKEDRFESFRYFVDRGIEEWLHKNLLSLALSSNRTSFAEYLLGTY